MPMATADTMIKIGKSLFICGEPESRDVIIAQVTGDAVTSPIDMRSNYLHKDWVIHNDAPWRVLSHAYHRMEDGPQRISGLLRANVDDFVVEEELGFRPDGNGEHKLLQVRKRDLNTTDVARSLARCAQVPVRDIGYCGLKDRRASATQWFSVRAPNIVDWSACNDEYLRVMSVHRHRRKLRRGSHRGNRFTIVVRQLTGERDALEQQLRQIREHGVPNYFGEQRFGHSAGNLSSADAMFAGALRVRDRHRRGLFLSAARSWLFNCVLSQRVAAGNWARLLPGDVASLDGSGSFFPVPQPDRELERRLEQSDIHPSGPLWGAGEPPTEGEVRALEQETLADFTSWCDTLAQAGMRHERRALRLHVKGLEWELIDRQLVLSFELQRGGFATSVLRECIDYRNAQRLSDHPS